MAVFITYLRQNVLERSDWTWLRTAGGGAIPVAGEGAPASRARVHPPPSFAIAGLALVAVGLGAGCDRATQAPAKPGA
jgi:hypothetical protein